LAYRAGVTIATSSLAKPFYLSGSEAHIISGLSATFRTGMAHAMQRGAIVQDVAALHVVMGKPNPTLGQVSVSTQMAALRRLLYGWETQDKETGHWFKQAAEVRLHLYIPVKGTNVGSRINQLCLLTGCRSSCHRSGQCRYYGQSSHTQS
jgi:hypothetical protein